MAAASFLCEDNKSKPEEQSRKSKAKEKSHEALSKSRVLPVDYWSMMRPVLQHGGTGGHNQAPHRAPAFFKGAGGASGMTPGALSDPIVFLGASSSVSVQSSAPLCFFFRRNPQTLAVMAQATHGVKEGREEEEEM